MAHIYVSSHACTHARTHMHMHTRLPGQFWIDKNVVLFKDLQSTVGHFLYKYQEVFPRQKSMIETISSNISHGNIPRANHHASVTLDITENTPADKGFILISLRTAIPALSISRRNNSMNKIGLGYNRK